MTTLSSWRHLLAGYPRTIRFPEVTLSAGRDHMPDVLTGRGEVFLQSSNVFDFSMRGAANDESYTFKYLRDAQTDPYDTFKQCRIVARDEAGVVWSLGWCAPKLNEIRDGVWKINGTIEGLMTDVRGLPVASSSVENIFEIPPEAPMGYLVGGFTERDFARGARSVTLDVVGTKLVFEYEPEKRLLSAFADTGSVFSHPHAENWIAEPFRIMLGQLVYPRLIARNFSDGRAVVSLRRTPSFIRNSDFVSLWRGSGLTTQAEFWNLYCGLLKFVATSCGDDGQTLFEANLLTSFYQEFAMAARGTRWVWALTFASAIEGFAKILKGDENKRPGVDEEAISLLGQHIQAWQGDRELKGRVIQHLDRLKEMTATHVLARERDRGVISNDELKSWKKMRNAVMHGELISPWSVREEDQVLRNLVSMMHKLAMQVLVASGCYSPISADH